MIEREFFDFIQYDYEYGNSDYSIEAHKFIKEIFNSNSKNFKSKKYANSIIRKAVEINPLFLSEIKDPDSWTCEVAVKNNGSALEFVPKNLRTPELCKLALDQDGEALAFVINQTEDLCALAVTSTPYALQYVQEKFMTPKVISRGIAMEPRVIEYIPADIIMNNSDCQDLLLRRPEFLSYVAKQTVELCLWLLTNEPTKKAYLSVKIVDRPNHEETLKNLNKALVKSTIKDISQTETD